MFHKLSKLLRKWPFFLVGFSILYIMEFFGVFTHFYELDYASSYQYPMFGDVKKYAAQIQKGLPPDVFPINTYNHTFLTNSSQKCLNDGQLRIVYMVKSAVGNIERRDAIRKSWGFERRFSDVGIRTIFFIGVTLDTHLHELVGQEKKKYNDIVEIDFIDDYYNNTLKTMSMMRWALQFCKNSGYYFFSDDDMYISTKNVLRFIRNPVEYPKYLETPSENNIVHSDPTKWLSNVYNLELPSDVVLYAGRVAFVSPLRQKNSKWYISLEEYPYDMYPPYVSAGCYILSRDALSIMYYTSLYTKHFRFDDIYLSFVALKAGVEPFHSNEFYIYSKPWKEGYNYAIAVHDFDDPAELVKIWTEQKYAGNA